MVIFDPEDSCPDDPSSLLGALIRWPRLGQFDTFMDGTSGAEWKPSPIRDARSKPLLTGSRSCDFPMTQDGRQDGGRHLETKWRHTSLKMSKFQMKVHTECWHFHATVV